MYSDDVGRVYFVKENGIIEDAKADARGDAWPPRDLLHGTAGHSGASMVYAVPNRAQEKAKAMTSDQEYGAFTPAFIEMCTHQRVLITAGCSTKVLKALQSESSNKGLAHITLTSPADVPPPPPPPIPLSRIKPVLRAASQE
jgi:hypothetical protein